MLMSNIRYLQIAFNYDLALVRSLLPKIPASDRILVEAGTPFIKREGTRGISVMRSIWKGPLIADMKTIDGAVDEVGIAHALGVDGITVLGSAPTEALDFFIEECQRLRMWAMIDMLGVQDPLDVLRPLKMPPEVVILHRGRDEESTRGKVIQYRHVNRIRSKYDVLLSAAGGVDLKEARSAIFNGASIVVVNLVKPGDLWQGISTADDVGALAQKFLETIS